MIQLNIEEPQSFELDCCPNCFGLWLDTGEESLLQKIFYEHTKSVPVTDFSSEQSAALGKIVMAQENVLRRYDLISKVGDFLSKKRRRFRRIRWNLDE